MGLYLYYLQPVIIMQFFCGVNISQIKNMIIFFLNKKKKPWKSQTVIEQWQSKKKGIYIYIFDWLPSLPLTLFFQMVKMVKYCYAASSCFLTKPP